ncbi:MAG: hypothetical protein QG661_1819 [Actinomycetota bacterium]|jgi:hypothetical protein|nr:hypothetical protein [Actinomycetota bacterium]
MTTTTTTSAIESLGYAIEARGIDADPVTLLLLAHTARDLGVSDLLVNVMTDEDQPANARVRAFARVSSAVSMTLSDEVVASAQRELLPAC